MKIYAKTIKTWTISLLAIGAVGFMAYQIMHSRAIRYNPPLPVPLLPAPAATNSAAAGAASQTNLPAIDRGFVESHWAQWVESPHRDPFLQVKPVFVPVKVVKTNQVTQLDHFTLKAIWRQHGVSMAAINQGIYRQGDALEDYQISRIDDKGVWLQINGRKELLGFARPTRMSAPEIPPAAAPAPEPHPDDPAYILEHLPKL
jgi:hypothetical protein